MYRSIDRDLSKIKVSWIVDKEGFCQLSARSKNDILSEKFKMLPKAQQRLIRAIQTEKNLIQPEIDDLFEVLPWFTNPNDNWKVYVPRLEMEPEHQLSFHSSKWVVKEPTTNIRNRNIILKESLKLNENSKIWMTSCIQLFKEEPLQPIPKLEKNPLLINVVEPVIDFMHQDYNKELWNMGTEDDLFDESFEEFCLPVESENIESPLPPVFFISDLKVIPPVLAESNYTTTNRVPTKLKKVWKFKKSVNWVVDASVRRGIFDELVSKFEVSFCVPVPVLKFKSENRLFIDKSAWPVSTYKTYMLNWKLFGDYNVRDVLEEKYDYNVVIPIIKDDLCKYITMDEMSKYKFEREAEDLPITLQSNLISFVSDIPDESIILNLPQESKSNVSSVKNETEVPDDYVVNNTKQSSHIFSSKPPSVEEIVQSPSSPSPITNTTNSKHKIDEIDTLIMKKKQRAHKTIMLDNNRYPYLDVFNQTTTFNLLPGTKSEVELETPASGEFVHVPLVRQQGADEGQILEFTEQSINYSLFEDIPDGKQLPLFVNISFADRFGAGFLQLTELVASEDRIELLDFTDDFKGLEFDMFLNSHCGAIFLRPINIYQRDLRSGENMIFSQIAEIAHTVTSLVLVIVVDEGDEDTKISQFLALAESYGIEVFVIDNDARKIAQAMVELVLKYGELRDHEFEWSSSHQFLEACGVKNPLLQEWILGRHTVEEFVSLSAGSREQMLRAVCSDELVGLVNEGVQRFVESFAR